MKNINKMVSCTLAIVLGFSTYSAFNYYNKYNLYLNKTNTLRIQKAVLRQEVEECNLVVSDLNDYNNSLVETINDLKDTEYKLVSLGEFDITYYCDERHNHICGGSGVTASGAPTSVGRTIAVDPKVIPHGTEVYIEGIGWRVAEDTGSAVKNNHIDVLVDTHEEALSQTLLDANVWVVVRTKS